MLLQQKPGWLTSRRMFACRLIAEFASKFAVFELSDEPAPKTFHEAAEKGNLSMLMKFIERTIDFDINQRVRWTAQQP
jgi:hypothetical protein